VVRRFGPGPTLVLGFAISGTGWLLLSLAPLNMLGIVAYALMLLMFGSARCSSSSTSCLCGRVTPAPMLAA